MAKFPKTLKIHVTQGDIDEGKCKDPHKCMLKLAIKREIGGHGYVSVESGTVAITRRPDYREKGFLPRPALNAMLNFDKDKESVKPFTFAVTFYKTTKIDSCERLDQKKAIARKHYKEGASYRKKKYSMRQRIAGIAYGGVAA